MLITNFTFDSVYSYLGSEISDCGLGLPTDTLRIPDRTAVTLDDTPVPLDVLEPLVSQLLAGYCHANTLLLLPGFIPIPSFFQFPSLPATGWVIPSTNRFRPEIESTLRAFSASDLCPPTSFPDDISPMDDAASNRNITFCRKSPRIVKYAPLLVRPASPGIDTHVGRQKLLASIGIPEFLHDPNQTHILLVSFGGQTIRRPYGGKSPSRTPPFLDAVSQAVKDPAYDADFLVSRVSDLLEEGSSHSVEDIKRPTATFSRKGSTQIFIPGAPAPAINPASSPHCPSIPQIVSGLHVEMDATRTLISDVETLEEEEEPSLLPSPSWIAIICGVPSNWSFSGDEDEDLPSGFYVAPRDVYMPDLTAIADVVLGKLVCRIIVRI